MNIFAFTKRNKRRRINYPTRELNPALRKTCPPKRSLRIRHVNRSPVRYVFLFLMNNNMERCTYEGLFAFVREGAG